MTESIEAHIMQEHELEKRPKKEKHILPDKAMLLEDLYQQQCERLKIKPDPTVTRLLEKKGLQQLDSLDLSNLTFTPPAFEAVMELCKVLPKLTAIDLSDTNLKVDLIESLVDMADDHPSLAHISLRGNNGLGFSAAKLLLPLIKNCKQFMTLDVEGTAMAPPTRDLIAKVLDQNRAAHAATLDVATELGSSAHVKGPKGQGLPGWMVGEMQVQELENSVDTPVENVTEDDTKGDTVDYQDKHARNTQVKNELLAFEAGNRSVLNKLVTEVHNRGKQVAEKLNQCPPMLTQYREAWSWPSKSTYGLAECIQSVGLSLTEENLESLYRVYTPARQPGLVVVRGVLEELLVANRRRKTTLLTDLTDRTRKHGPGVGWMAGGDRRLRTFESRIRRRTRSLSKSHGIEDGLHTLDTLSCFANNEQEEGKGPCQWFVIAREFTVAVFITIAAGGGINFPSHERSCHPHHRPLPKPCRQRH
eukprot:NODE_377_length_1722_cov_311.658099_g299_i0.p1 GENE.NODE_377_length_1722_cov_311.658099_g299_i0~~NODE_377_length_1722_cov_311.658099_g299_i0.p1  ORF type:complete len:475 (-),score=84.07 NODE_377_length_1722_cov_311.658099_g299_i0:232-1656(-)